MADVIEIAPMILIEFSKYGAFARKHWPSGKIEDMPVEEAMKELAAAGAFERSHG